MKTVKKIAGAALVCLLMSQEVLGEEFKETPILGSVNEVTGAKIMVGYQQQRLWAAVRAESPEKITVEPQYVASCEQTGYPVEGRSRRVRENGLLDEEISFAPWMIIEGGYAVSIGEERKVYSRYMEMLMQLFWDETTVKYGLEAGLAWPDWSANDWIEEWEEQ